jgi:hypothetical protein
MNEKRVLHSEASICSTLDCGDTLDGGSRQGRLAWMSRKIASTDDTSQIGISQSARSFVIKLVYSRASTARPRVYSSAINRKLMRITFGELLVVLFGPDSYRLAKLAATTGDFLLVGWVAANALFSSCKSL